MKKLEEENNNPNEISSSINILNEKEEEIQNENKIIKKDDNITLEDLENIINESDKKEKEEKSREKEPEQNNEKIIVRKESTHSSKDEMLETELSIIKKQNLSKYLMENKQFKTTTNESEEDLEQKIKPTKCKLYKYVGRTLFLFLDKYENPILIIGPHWPMYLCFCGIISLIMLAVYLILWKQIGMVMRILGHICFWTFFISYTHCSLYNPGYPKNDIGRNFGHPREEYYFCNRCQFYLKRSKYAHHCFDCDICIENHDHHCPWTGHCIGKNNYYTFIIFVGSSFFIIAYLASAICIGASEYN